MIRYLLDTDVTSQPGKSKPNAGVSAWLDSVRDDELAISVVTLRERLEGVEIARRNAAPHAAELQADVEKLTRAYAGRILPIDEEAARVWAGLLAENSSRSDDKAQLAVAAANGLTLVTLNWRDVRGYGVPVLNPGRRPPKLYV